MFNDMSKNRLHSCGEEETTAQDEQLISVKDVARRCSMSERAIWRHIAGGTLPKPVKVGRCTRFFQSDVLRWLSGLREQQV